MVQPQVHNTALTQAAEGKQLEKILLFVLVMMMALRISSYFTLFPNSVGVTRVVKIGLRFMLTGVSGVFLLALISRRRQYEFKWVMLMPFLFYCAYLLLGFISMIWSTDLAFTVLQLMMTTESIVFVFLFYKIITLYDTMYQREIPTYNILISRAVTIISVAFIIGLLIDPSTFYRQTHGGEVSRLGGFIINPNELGMLAVLGATCGYLELFYRKNIPINVIGIILAIAILLLTQSRSSLGAFLLVTGIFILKLDNPTIKIGIIAIGVAAMPFIINTIIIKQGDIEEVMSMTGRLPFWSDLITYGFPERPLLGYGFMSISPSPFTAKFDSIHAYAASMTHNTFVQVLINLGLVGAFIVLFQMITTFYAVGTAKNKKLQLMAACMLIPLIINSLTEFGIFGESNYGIMFYQFIILAFTIEATKKERPTYKGRFVY